MKEKKKCVSNSKKGNSKIPKTLKKKKKKKIKVLNQIQELENTLNLINFKCWYYSESVKQGTDEYVKKMPVTKMPTDIQIFYKKAHKLQ